MARVIRGADVAAVLKAEIAEDLEVLGGYIPHLVIMRAGARVDDVAYEQSATKKCEQLGLRLTTRTFPQDVSHEEFEKAFREVNDDSDVDGILVLRPLPEQIDEEVLDIAIDIDKDIDCMSPVSLSRVFIGEKDTYAPCTPEAVMRVLEFAGVDIRGKRATVIGRSMVVGKPLSILLMSADATVMTCHTKTADLPAACRNAEILVSAAGCVGLVTKDHVSDGAIVIDVAINDDGKGGICGDVLFDEVAEKASIITPVPGGLGSVTTLVLLTHLTRAARKRKGIPRIR